MKKMYIAVLDEFPDFMTPTLVAHAVLREHLHKTSATISPCKDYEDWIQNSFRKCVLRVSAKEYEKIKALVNTHKIVVTESWENNTLGGKGSCLTCVVDSDAVPNVLKFAKLWKPKSE
jgi:hypothetical protein